VKRIQLCIDRILQGTFELQALNLLFVFQVNCPGCFIYGFPLVNKLYWQYRDRGLNVLGLSTAFEDFDYNTAKNTQLLLTEKKTVGATRKALGDDYLQTIDFAIAVDCLTTGLELDTLENMEFFCEAIPDFDLLPKTERDRHRQAVTDYLQRTPKTSSTFFLNQLPGTPTFLLVNQNLQLLEGWFGHSDETAAIALLDKYAQRPSNLGSIQSQIV
jgi:hypothetical protein